MTEELHAAVDTGGTFTDVAIRRKDGSLFVWKVPSMPSEPDQAVINGITGAMHEMNADIRGISRFVHGTTVATNTVITRTGARVGLLTTAGFRDLLDIGHQSRPSLYDQHRRRSAPLVPTEFVEELSERISDEGEVLQAIDDAELEAVADRLRAQNLDVLVVSFLNSYVNPEHETYAVEKLSRLAAAPTVFAASDISPEMREYERTSTGTINAYVQPKISTYVGRLARRIVEAEIPAPLWIMQSNGGLLSPELAARHSARTVLSGLAGGVVGAAMWAARLNLPKVVSFDIGGTSTDIALIRQGRPDETMFGEVDELPLRLPSVDVHTIGAGGGSIAWVDSGGGLRVGPQSAGAIPGPISYKQGGTETTVTDAHVVLGRLGTSLLGDRFELDVQAARDALTAWGERLGMSAEDAAEGIIRVITATMARGIRKVSVERGVDVRACDLIAFGGAGPLHGSDLIRELGMKSAVIPPMPGIASAVGMLDAPERHDFSAQVQVHDEEQYGELGDHYAQLDSRARTVMRDGDADYAYFVDVRYTGQSYELTVPYAGNWDSQRAVFDAAHTERYGFSDADAHMEIVVARLVVRRGGAEAGLARDGRAQGPAPEPIESRPVYFDGAWRDTLVYERADFTSGTTLTGPLIINQFDTTIYVGPDQELTSDEYGFLHLAEKGTS